MTYGEYQEAASRDLVALLSDRGMCESAAGELVLACRGQILATLLVRLAHLGARLEASAGNDSRRASHVAVTRDPLNHLAQILRMLQRDGDRNLAPSEVLRSDLAGSAAIWGSAARYLFLATSELLRADRQPWRDEAEVAWPLVGDIADVVEAVVLLDSRLASTGLLERCTPRRTASRVLMATDVSRLARLAGRSNEADLATAGSASLTAVPGRPITLVRGPEGFADAQRHLAALVRPIKSSDDPGCAADRPGLHAARVLALGQVRLADAFASWAETSGHRDLAKAFRGRVPAFRALHAASVRLVDCVPHRSPLAVIQQSEMTMRLRDLHRPLLSREQLSELNDASHAVATAIGRALRREGLTARNLLALVENGNGLPVPRPIVSTRHPFHVACKALAELPVATLPPSITPVRPARKALRRKLDEVRLPLRGQLHTGPTRAL